MSSANSSALADNCVRAVCVPKPTSGGREVSPPVGALLARAAAPVDADWGRRLPSAYAAGQEGLAWPVPVLGLDCRLALSRSLLLKSLVLQYMALFHLVLSEFIQ